MEWTLKSAREDYKIEKKYKKCNNCKFCNSEKITNPYFDIDIFYSCKVKGITVNDKLSSAKTCKYFTYKN